MLLLLVTMPAAAAQQKVLLVMGDSLSAAYNLPTQEGWVALTAERMKKSHPQWKVVNASISGESNIGLIAKKRAWHFRARKCRDAWAFGIKRRGDS